MNATIHIGDVIEKLQELAPGSIQCCVTSPPYWGLRDYGVAGQIGQEPTPEEYISVMVRVFREVRRVLAGDGVLWLNLGDSYAHDKKWGGETGGKQSYLPDSDRKRFGREKRNTGLAPKNLVGIPWRTALALQADGWYLRQDIIWHKPNPMPESVSDRCTKSHEYIFMLTKSARYHYDNDAIREPYKDRRVKNGVYSESALNKKDYKPNNQAFNGKGFVMKHRDYNPSGRNKRSVWTVSTRPYSGAHFATFPPKLIEPCILATSRGAGKRCGCDEVINTPTGEGGEDPTMITGRAGMNREKMGGVRPITRREQRHEANQIKISGHIDEIRAMCGGAFDHYIRTDKSGARPLPQDIRKKLFEKRWITKAPPCKCKSMPADVVLDPFCGAGTTGLVALAKGRDFIGIELNPEYAEMGAKRIHNTAPVFYNVDLAV